MKEFVFLFYGYSEPTPEVMEAWNRWFASIDPEVVVDGGNPLGNGREVTPSGARALSAEMGPATGYMILESESMDGAVKLLEGCPIISSVRVYEAIEM